ncbi:MAG: hemolysin III family protein [Deltaproteobacteria bacterium]|nr:MAG: hemolysin III family protein [Deltaproteobacteria bacterium]
MLRKRTDSRTAVISPIETLSCPINGQNRREEWFNTLTHGLGLVLSVVGLLVMAIYSGMQGDLGLFICCSIFGSTMVMTYAASTLYHSSRFYYAKKTLQTLDHSCIYLLIAGSYTPFTVLALGGTWGWGFFSFAWGMAIVGIALKFLISKRHPFWETMIYLAMGWAAVLIFVPLQQSLPLEGFALLIAGGLFYSVGTVFYIFRQIPYHHGIWHLFVMAGSACHFFSVYFTWVA